MVALSDDYKNLEERTHDAHLSIGDNQITFGKDEFEPPSYGELTLERGVEEHGEGNHIVRLVMPWNNIYQLGKYRTEQEAKRAFEDYDSALRNGCRIEITGGDVAIKPKE